jgi:hypothetical protein
MKKVLFFIIVLSIQVFSQVKYSELKDIKYYENSDDSYVNKNVN